jgi:hypothetical protein
VKQWDAEWGRLETEGNLWWLGSKRANWQATMGSSKWGWICELILFGYIDVNHLTGLSHKCRSDAAQVMVLFIRGIRDLMT